jgi:glutamate-ammonia-ligase adenylyltransferase
VVERAEAEVRASHGEPAASPGEGPPGFLVLALGKLGGQEMNYRSDLDIVFLYASPSGEREKPAAREYFVAMAQRLYGLLTRPGKLGSLWETDVRLRPMGTSNPLAVSIEEWQRYFAEGTAGTWERQAFLRARPVAGDAALGRAALAFIRDHMPLEPSEDPAALAADVVAMRKRLEASVTSADLKRGHGGIVDVEFIVQHAQLRWGREHPELIHPNTVVGLERLIEGGWLDPLVGSELLSAYQFLRWLETRLSLLLASGESIGSIDRKKLRALIERIGYRSTHQQAPEEIFHEELKYHRERNRRHFEELLGAGGAE